MRSNTAELASRSAGSSRALPNFDPVARIYRWAEYLALGTLLQRTREQFLPEIAASRHALVLGDGDGRFTAALLSRAPHLSVRAVDTSAAMLRLLRERCVRAGTTARLTTEQASAQAIDASSLDDLIVTHFFLDCLTQTEVNTLAAKLRSQVKPGCLWVISDFDLPRNRFARPFAAIYIRLLYLAFRVLTGLGPQELPDPQSALLAAGFQRLKRVERFGGLLYSELWHLLPREPQQQSRAESRPMPAVPGKG